MMKFLGLSWTATGKTRTSSCWILLTMVRIFKVPVLNAVHGNHLLLADVVQYCCSHALAAAEVHTAVHSIVCQDGALTL